MSDVETPAGRVRVSRWCPLHGTLSEAIPGYRVCGCAIIQRACDEAVSEAEVECAYCAESWNGYFQTPGPPGVYRERGLCRTHAQALAIKYEKAKADLHRLRELLGE